MPQHKSAIKRVRQNERRRIRNRDRRIKMRTLIKSVLTETEKGKAEEQYKQAVSYLDKMATKGIIHKNFAARKKAKLTEHINSL